MTRTRYIVMHFISQGIANISMGEFISIDEFPVYTQCAKLLPSPSIDTHKVSLDLDVTSSSNGNAH